MSGLHRTFTQPSSPACSSFAGLRVEEGSDIWPRQPQDRLSLDGANGGLDGHSSPVQGKRDRSSRTRARYHSIMKANDTLHHWLRVNAAGKDVAMLPGEAAQD